MTGRISWFEVLGEDGDKLRKFYAELFDWKIEPLPGMDYGVVQVEDGQIAGGIGKAEHGAGWSTFYVQVDDLEASLEKAKASGGQVLVPITTVPETRIAVITDPEGHPLGLSQPL